MATLLPRFCLSVALVVLPCSVWSAVASPIALSDGIVQLSVVSGPVEVFFAGSEAAFDLQLFQSDPVLQGPFFPNHDTPVGASESLGIFPPATELAFRLDVLSTGDRFFTGSGAGNPDGVVHARGRRFPGSAVIPAGVLIGFEDLFGGGDLDFNDFTFVVTNVALRSTPVPEPATWLLLGSGMAALLRAARCRRKGRREDNAAPV
jgi:hypothetical protein